jgi:poly-beta-1,6-N-acetyl-D-glucosamine synthase
MNAASYVIITPAWNAQATIQATIESVIRQTILPKEWVIVSDGSTDQTEEIVRSYAAQHGFLHLVRLEHKHAASFASVVAATEAGYKALRSTDYDYIGLLDADVRFPSDYYERLVCKFVEDPSLGLAGGRVGDIVNGKARNEWQNLNEVAGATQFFRRSCFESTGGLIAIREGGGDAITCVCARMKGYRTRTFTDLVMEHLKPRNSAYGHPILRKWQMGVRDHALASLPLFEVAKCFSRIVESPPVLGAAVRLTAYLTCMLQARKVILAPDIVRFIHEEQWARLLPFRRTGSRSVFPQP